MKTELTPHRMPWDTYPVAPDELIKAMQRDLAFMVAYTGVKVHSSQEHLRLVVNTPRGQIIPRGEVRFTDGTTLEFQDIGMPQPNAQTMTVPELIACVHGWATQMGLEL